MGTGASSTGQNLPNTTDILALRKWEVVQELLYVHQRQEGAELLCGWIWFQT